MVYCVKCGAKNLDDVKVCSQCGAPLYVTREPQRYRRIESECFGIPRGGTIVGLAIGLIIVLAGLSLYFQEVYQISLPWWPVAVIVFGILMVVGAIYGLSRRY
jgi:uncharacterized membrane protein YvbJ